jgi:hypothetical protein
MSCCFRNLRIEDLYYEYKTKKLLSHFQSTIIAYNSKTNDFIAVDEKKMETHLDTEIEFVESIDQYKLVKTFFHKNNKIKCIYT